MNKKGNVLIILVVIAALAIAMLFYFKTQGTILRQLKQNTTPIVEPSKQKEINEDNQPKSYVSKDLKISFEYPKDWFVEEEYPFILISNFKSSLHKDVELENNQIEIMIREFSNCFPTLEEDLISPACGQGEVKNKIISKEAIQAPGGEFLEYTIDSPDENQRTQYFFRKDEKILDIEKYPDPSQFEKEFEEIINSINFL